MLGNAAEAGRVLVYLTDAAAAVDAAGEGKTGTDRTEARQEAALKRSILLVERTKTPAPGTAALSKACGAGYDMVVNFGEVAQHGQAKGRETGPAAGAQGGDALVKPSNLAPFLRDLKRAAAQATTALEGKTTVAGGDVPLHLEMLFAGKASPTTKQILSGCSTGEESRDTAQKFREILHLLGPKTCALVMMRAELRTALGPIFGGIAARCNEEEAEKVAAASAAEDAPFAMDTEEREDASAGAPDTSVRKRAERASSKGKAEQGKDKKVPSKRVGSDVMGAKNTPRHKAAKKK